MKDFFIIIFLIVIILTGGIWINRYLKNTSEELKEELYSLRDSIKKMDEQKTSEMIDKVYEKWEQLSAKWSIVVLHSDIDSIEVAIVNCKALLESKEYSKSLEEIDRAIFLINNVNDKDKISLKNIF